MEVRSFLGPTYSLPQQTGPVKGHIRPRQRKCLLKGCEKTFHPTHIPQAHYCSPECQAAAQQWRHLRRKARGSAVSPGEPVVRKNARSNWQRWPESEFAERRQSAEAQEAAIAASEPGCACPMQDCEGQRPAHTGTFFCCDRPGCYTEFVPSKRSPCQRFCSAACRQALRRIARARAALGSNLGLRHELRADARAAAGAVSWVTEYGSLGLRTSLQIHCPQRRKGRKGSRACSGPPAPFSDIAQERGQ